MWHDGRAIKIAVVGGLRIPFCRAHTNYASCSNQDMMTAALAAIVEKFDLKGQVLGDVAPANTTLFVHDLVGPGFLVEIELDAYCGHRS